MEKTKTTKPAMVCPNCGSEDLEFVAATSAVFEVNPDGTIGNPILDAEGIDFINACISPYIGDIECHCRNCHSSFAVSEKEEEEFTITEEI